MIFFRVPPAIPRSSPACVPGGARVLFTAGLLLGTGWALAATPPATPRTEASPLHTLAVSLDVADVVSEFPVGFSLLTHGPTQYVAFYDHERWMTVAARTVTSTNWSFHRLPSRIGWDSHNYVTLALDEAGHLHVAGNMHGVPLVYFRTERVGDIASLAPRAMTGEREKRVTYPKFFRDGEGRLVFAYRDGGSGNGDTLYNVYDPATRSWRRLLDTPLFDGEGERNAYPLGPVRGPDGWFHVLWVWRDTPDCATNHHLSHARSRDLLKWESVFGEPVSLPLRLSEKRLWVDDVPSGGGIINGCERLAFDADGAPVLAYHKRDERGNMQVFAARPEGREWKRRVLTSWGEPLPFSGGGTMGFIGIRLGDLRRAGPGVMTLSYRHRDEGGGWLSFAEKSLAPVSPPVPPPPELPRELTRVQGNLPREDSGPGEGPTAALARVQGDCPGLEIRRAEDLGDSGDPAVRYVLQWETLGANQDRPRQPPQPPPSRLRLHRLGGSD